MLADRVMSYAAKMPRALQRTGYHPGYVAVWEPALQIARLLLAGAFYGLVAEPEIKGLTKESAQNLNKQLVHMQQHVSYLDPLITPVVLRKLGLEHPYIATGANLMVGFMGKYFCRLVGGFPVDRRKLPSSLEGFRKLNASQREEVTRYSQGLQEYAKSILNKGRSLLFYPSGTRSRTGFPEYSKGNALTVFAKPLIECASDNGELEAEVSAVNYEFNPDILEFEKEDTSRQLQAHKGVWATLAEYMQSSPNDVFFTIMRNLLTSVEKKPEHAKFGKVYVTFAEPIRIADYKSVGRLKAEVYKRIKQAVVVTDTALVMAALADKEGLSRKNLEETVNRWHSALMESDANTECHETAAEIIEYAEHILAPLGVLSIANGAYTARQFPASYFRNNIAYHLERAGVWTNFK